MMLRVAVCAAVLAALSACDAGESGEPDRRTGVLPSEAAVATNTASRPAVRPTTRPPGEEPGKSMVDFLMPDFSGQVLQDAQNQVQELGIFFSKSHDLRGGRNQLIDSNWRVCTQSPQAGTRIKGTAAEFEGKIDFGVVKLTEACP